MAKVVFVFGSNLAGRHGAGSALEAVRRHGAINGYAIGPQGDSYAIPTKDENLNTLSLALIKSFVNDFIQYAREHPELQFKVVAIGCGLAGYKPHQIAPMFKGASDNVLLPREFK
jgi:hypothetical protein